LNPGFEEVYINNGKKAVKNWTAYTAGTVGNQKFEVIQDKKQAHTGKICIKMESSGGYIADIGAFIPVKPGKIFISFGQKVKKNKKLLLLFTPIIRMALFYSPLKRRVQLLLLLNGKNTNVLYQLRIYQ